MVEVSFEVVPPDRPVRPSPSTMTHGRQNLSMLPSGFQAFYGVLCAAGEPLLFAH